MDITKEQLQDAVNEQVNGIKANSVESTQDETTDSEDNKEVIQNNDEGPKPEPEKKDNQADKPKSGFAKLLAQRNSAQKLADENAKLLYEKNIELQEAKKKIQELNSKEVSEDEARSHDLELVDAISKKNTLELYISGKKSDGNSQFYRDMPEALEIKDKLDEIIKKHPTLSHYEALTMYVGANPDIIESVKVDDQKQNQKKNYDLLGSPSAGGEKSGKSGMSNQDTKELLRKSILSGDLTL